MITEPLAFLGDSHNFGRRVSRVEKSESSLFFKPRTVVWERLLFSKSSELLVRVKQSGNCSHPNRGTLPAVSKYLGLFEESIFGLEVIEQGHSGGFAKQVSDDSLAPRLRSESELLLMRAGFLLAYCYVCGVQDLHRGNVLVSHVQGQGRLQVVDAEVVFSDLTLPNETLLLPFRNNVLPKTGFGALLEASGKGSFNSSELKQIVSGYVSGMHFMHDAAPLLNEAIGAQMASLADIPIRAILRPTREYAKYLNQVSASALPSTWLEAERWQFSRNDIPYFFKFLGRPEVYQYTSPDLDYRHVRLAPELEALAAKVACLPEGLLERDRIKHKLFAPGLLLVLRKLTNPKERFSFATADHQAEIFIDEKRFRIESEWGNFETGRDRVVH